MSNRDGKRGNVKLRDKVLASLPIWFKNGWRRGKGPCYPYSYDHGDGAKLKEKYLENKEKEIE